MTSGIGRLLPRTIEVAEAAVDVPDALLLPEEQAIVENSVPTRRAEFATTRECARQALVRLGHPRTSVLSGPHREPLWPSGVVGSLTHCDGYRAAAVAHAADILTLGIDAERHEPLPPGVARLITVDAERCALEELTFAEPSIAWDRLIFSAKESIFKAWFPLSHTSLDFTECEVRIEPDIGTFVGYLLRPGLRLGGRTLSRFSGRWSIQGRHIITAVCEPASGPTASAPL